MAQLTEQQKSDMGGPQQTAAEGESWTAGDPPTREALDPGVNSPQITGNGWRRMIRRMRSAKGMR